MNIEFNKWLNKEDGYLFFCFNLLPSIQIIGDSNIRYNITLAWLVWTLDIEINKEKLCTKENI